MPRKESSMPYTHNQKQSFDYGTDGIGAISLIKRCSALIAVHSASISQGKSLKDIADKSRKIQELAQEMQVLLDLMEDRTGEIMTETKRNMNSEENDDWSSVWEL